MKPETAQPVEIASLPDAWSYFDDLLHLSHLSVTEQDKDKEDLIYLCKSALGYEDAGRCQQEVSDWIDAQIAAKPEGRRLFLLVLMPRGHLKSSVITVGKSIQFILRNPDIRILIDNAVWDNSRSFLRSITEHVATPYFEDTFGMHPTRSTVEQLTVSTRRKTGLKEPTIDTSGVEKTKTGQHYDVIIADDLVSRENIGTAEMLEKTVTHFKDLLSLLEPDGTIIVIGTRWHDYDLYGRILDPLEEIGAEFKTYVKEAIEDGTIAVREVDGEMVPYMTGGRIIFPEKFNEHVLCGLYRDLGQYEFFAQYFNRTVDDEHATFKRSWIEKNLFGPGTKRPDTPPLEHYLNVDVAFSEKQMNDDTAFVTTGLAEDNDFYVVDTRTMKTADPDRVISTIFDLHEKYHYRYIGIEEVAAQKVLSFYINKEMMRRKVRLPLEIIKRGPSQAKELRIKALQPFFEFGRFHLMRDQHELIDQLTRFPRGKHDDLIDALADVLLIAKVAPRTARTKFLDPRSIEAVRKQALGFTKRPDVIGNENARRIPDIPYGGSI